jgi:metal-sulfur cluster biosynthetic enzyme
MPITRDAVLTALARIIEPDLKKDIVELDLVQRGPHRRAIRLA